jgi:hypothetical protein
LAEIAISLPTIGVLTVGMCSAVLLTVRAIPQRGSMLTAAVEATQVMEQLERDLRCATHVDQRESNNIQFSVPDRNGDGQPETIRYWWSGSAGTPILRQFNGGASDVVLEQAEEFLLSYNIQPRTTFRVEETTTTSAEILLASFESWPGVLPEIKEYPINSVSWIGTTFQLPESVPRNYSKLRFTRASCSGRRVSGNATARVGVYRVTADRVPRVQYRLGDLTTVASETVPWIPFWFTTNLSDNVIATDGSRTFALIYSSTGSSSTLRTTYFSSESAPNNLHPTARWTGDGGGTWEPNSGDLPKNDLLFRIFGVYETIDVTKVPETTPHVQSVGVRLRSATSKSYQVDTALTLLNQPEVGP